MIYSTTAIFNTIQRAFDYSWTPSMSLNTLSSSINLQGHSMTGMLEVRKCIIISEEATLATMPSNAQPNEISH